MNIDSYVENDSIIFAVTFYHVVHLYAGVCVCVCLCVVGGTGGLVVRSLLRFSNFVRGSLAVYNGSA